MRRLVLVFLMLLMSIQSTWTAAASVCTHEQAKVGQRHFGHHDAHHEDSAATASATASADDAQSGDRGRANTLDNDHHHVLNVHPVPYITLLPSPVTTAQRERPNPFDRYPSALIASLERPPKATADSLRPGF